MLSDMLPPAQLWMLSLLNWKTLIHNERMKTYSHLKADMTSNLYTLVACHNLHLKK
jgi:hypothetical protein